MTVSEKCILEVDIPFNNNFIVEADDFYECFRKLREMDKSITYYCKGARLNVLPSRMARQMTMGMSAYETTRGKPARKEDLVDIFDYEDQGLVLDPERQDEYQKEWFLSLKH
ncbi:hypothetical protein [Pantoea cypripedii]|uniref:Uncharacterized protein n=1 Tax=Pantoea cypripedii TaxID=55209 RepID=A0A1X1EMG0_PANCY|nr:hypothetical protein [Pantoea cypripedii]MBP2198247.1 hypothetical protein [Pantoea cypripedii]ORM90158.1 hypothetical protein HA50_26795 [Pantoea cypripedii]